MAVKKTKKEEVVEEVVTTEEAVENTEVEVTVEEPIEVEVLVEEPKKEEPAVEIDSSAMTVDKSKMPKGNVKIRMRNNHRCTIAMVRYELEAGKTYTVPENVKRILDKAGVLAPLN